MKKLLSISILFATVTLSVVTASEKPEGNTTGNMTTSITGTVIDETSGETLAGVTVSLEGIDQIVYTDFDGNFAFKGITPGEYTIKTRLISYKEYTLRVNAELKKKNTVDLKLKSVSN